MSALIEAVFPRRLGRSFRWLVTSLVLIWKSLGSIAHADSGE